MRAENVAAGPYGSFGTQHREIQQQDRVRFAAPLATEDSNIDAG